MRHTNLMLPRPARWKLVLAFAIVYVSWGTTYLAIKEGVKTLPPALFGGVRIALAGLLLLGFLGLRGERLRLPWREILWAAAAGGILFTAGNGLISVAQQTVPSGAASILVATTPLWIALLDLCWPWGERLTGRGWVGLLIGLGGVLLLFTPKLGDPAALLGDAGPFLVLASAFSWALGSLVVRYRRRDGSPLVPAAYQMVLGGLGLAGIGLVLGQHEELTAERFTFGAVFSFCYLLTVGSLLGFVAYTWLLGHVSAALAGTYAYVNPLVALLIGWLLGGEEMTSWLLGGVVVILAGVALVRSGGTRDGRRHERAPVREGEELPPGHTAGRAWPVGPEAARVAQPVTGRCQSP